MFGLKLRLGPLGGEGGSGVIQHSGLGEHDEPQGGGEPFDMRMRPTELQRKALELLGVSLTCTQ